MKSYNERVGARVAAAIRAAGLTQLSVCERTGIDRVTLWRRLSGRRPFDLDQLDAIAKALGVSVRELVGEERAA